MALLYQVDFRTLASQLTLTPGARTIDGLPWWLKGALTPGGGRTFACSLINGTGLRIAHVAGTPSGIGSNGDLNEPHWFLPLSAIPGWISTQALLIRTRCRLTSASGLSIVPMTGIVDTTSDAVGLRAAQRAKDHLLGPTFSTGVITELTVKWGAASPAGGRIGRAGAIANNSCVVGLMNNQIAGWATHGSELLATTVPTSINSYLPGSGSPSSTTGDPHFQWTTRSNPGILYGFETQFSGWTVDLEFLRIDVIGEILDASPPQVALVSPPALTNLTPTQSVTLDFTDSASLAYRAIYALYDGLVDGRTVSELVYDSGDPSLVTLYDVSSAPITGGWRHIISRHGGWPAAPRFRARAVDGGGNVV